MTFGEKLQKLRKAHGWTQEQLAEKVGVSRQSLSGWETDTALPDTANVIALADLFGVTTDYLLRSEDENSAQPAVEAAQPEPPKHRWYMSPRELGARLMVAIAAIWLIVLRMLASVYPANVGISDERGIYREYTGFAGFLQFYDLWWALYLLLIVLALGLLQWFGPWLWQQGKRLWQQTEKRE